MGSIEEKRNPGELLPFEHPIHAIARLEQRPNVDQLAEAKVPSLFTPKEQFGNFFEPTTDGFSVDRRQELSDRRSPRR